VPSSREPDRESDRLPADVERVRAPNPGPLTLSGTNTYLVGRPAWVIDPGPADASHVDRVWSEAHARGGIAGIALTHRHLDHAESAAVLSERAGAPLAACAMKAAGDDSFREPEVSGLRADVALGEGDSFGPLVAIETPGHSADHLCFLAGTVLFCGDTVLGEGSVFIPPGGGSLASYLRSLRKLEGLQLAALCPGHGPVVWRPREKITQYIEHRLERERRLVAALERGLRRRDELLDEVWDDAPAELRPAAALTLEAHLDKLETERRLPSGVERLRSS
jgi:glyoxylase-like metal-dependent hydrolase (beta-lactamase superfamily II)